MNNNAVWECAAAAADLLATENGRTSNNVVCLAFALVLDNIHRLNLVKI